MIRRQARTKRTYALFPYTTLFRSGRGADVGGVLHSLHRLDHHEAHDLAVHLCWGRLVEVHPGAHGAEAAHALRRVAAGRSDEHTSELQSLMRISYAVFCLTNKKYSNSYTNNNIHIRFNSHTH